ncbi:PVC-type heme-binding CxxCH protein [Haladaptatus sp. DYF46]|uniref:PVC-type heme-binding CxxCH protein n=1 Tax=Haladaptatus sp. DYF46 TaxID=2886041 RepID=UPI001E472B39|nr:PVC-type heme-binding CxxCH protein [Haladaptatus sp. DYF46]
MASGENSTDQSKVKNGESITTSRRDLMRLVGGIGAAGVIANNQIGTGMAASDSVIKLEAIKQDPTNSELEWDINDDGSVNYDDVVDLFHDFESDEIQNNPEAYDFNQNDQLDFDDIVTLFKDIDDQDEGNYAWAGVTPEKINGEINPTLSLTAGEDYTVEWTNTTGGDHNFVIEDADGNEVLSSELMGEKGSTQTVEFTATDEMAVYYCESHPISQRGKIETSPVTEPSEETISVLMMGGPEGGSHNAPARQLQITEYLMNRGIEVAYTDRLDDLKPDVLHRYDAWIMCDNRSGLTQSQEDSIIEFVESGGGFIPIHSASACFTESDAYIDLVGGQFQEHGYGEMTTTFEQPNHPILSTLDPIVSEDETYRHTNLNDDINVLAYGDFPDYGSNEDLEPWIWTRTQGDGRVFYTAWGHGRGTWATDGFKKLIENAIRWVTRNEDSIGNDTRVLDQLEFIEANIPYYPPPEGGLLPREVPEEVGEGTDWKRMQRALDPEQTIDRMIMPEGFDLQPFTTEDMLPDDAQGNIMDMSFDEQGRVWLAVTKDYPNDLGDNQDKIVIGEDTNGDGQVDEFSVFAEGLSIPTSMVLVENGVIVAHHNDPSESGQMLLIRDTNGDDQADERQVLFSGFGNGDTHAGPNELVHGIDNWIWGQVGYSGFGGTVAGEQYNFSSSIYRFKLDTSDTVTDFEIVGGLPGNQAGLGITEEGLVFGSAATSGRPSNYVAIPDQYYELINGTSPTDFGPASDTNRFLPVTDRVRQVDRHGGYTAATGHTIYTARKYPRKYWNNTAFVGDGTGNLLGTFYLQQNGAGYNTHYAHNFAGSIDAWSAPSYSAVGPDGLLWFIDWYNYIYQHNPTPDGFENGPGNAYITELRDHATSRIYRATYDDESGYQPKDLSDATPSDLVSALSDDNMFWRRTAQRKLVERGKSDVVPDLVSLVTSESVDEIGLDPGAIHALWTLDGLGALSAESGSDSAIDASINALTHSSAGVRLTALRVAPTTSETRGAILDNDLLNDEDQRVAMWALLTLAETPESDASGEAVYQMISSESNYEDNILVDAASVAGAQHADGFIGAYEANEDTDTSPPDLDDQPNLFQNPSMEEPAGGSVMPVSWSTTTYTGSADFTYEDTGYDGENCVRIHSDDGADASWNTSFSVEPNTDYTISGWIKTDNLQPVDGSGFGEGPLGATFNVEQIANTGSGTQWDTIPDGLTGTNDWTKIEITINSGDHEELSLNLLYGGYGEATGTAWFDSISFTDPDGNNAITNPSFEEDDSSGSQADLPANWEPETYGGTAEFSYTSDVARSGEDSVRIDSTDGADASWTQFVELEPNSQYRFRAWVRTSDDFHNTGDSYGVTLNVHSLGRDSVTDSYAEPVDGWKMLETTFTTGGSSSELQLNLLFGGWGNAVGTVWFDDAELKKVGGFGNGLEVVYQRVMTHVESGGNDDDDSDDTTVIDPDTTIELEVESNEEWTGVAPASIEGEGNPTLTLEPDAEYTVEWTNRNGAPHNFEIVDSNDEVVQDVSTPYLATEGESQTVSFTSTDEIAEYVCRAHNLRMRGTVELAGSDSN